MANICDGTDAILKLDLGGKGGIHRIPLTKLWDPDTSRVSYQRLSEMAIQYSNLSDSKLHSVTVTYNDEDGDIITISTDEELTDAFEHFSTRIPPIVRVKASFNVEKNCERVMNGLKQAVSEISETVKKRDGGNNAAEVNQIQDSLDSFTTMLTQAVDVLSRNMEGAKQNNKKEGCRKAVSKEVTARSTGDKACGTEMKIMENNVNSKTSDTTCNDDRFKDLNMSSEVEERKQEDYSNILAVKADLDKNFIHGRHTCDGCLVTPIIGIRYHALNLPDYDLCEMCIHKHSRKDIIFEPTELERDRYLQEKLKRRQWRKKREDGGRCNTQKEDGGRCDTQNRDTLAVCSFDSALKEAIRRSLEDVKPENEEKKSPERGERKNHDIEEVEACMDEEEEEEEGDVEVLADDENDEEGSKGDSNLASAGVINEELGATETEAVGECDEIERLKLEEELPVDSTAILPTPTKSLETSFTKDAEGKGDVAIAIGMALDVTANAIDAVLSEVEKSLDDINNEHETKSGVDLELTNTINNNSKSDISNQSQFSADSNDEWQVEDRPDEIMSQATQLLGSALFQSDVIADTP